MRVPESFPVAASTVSLVGYGVLAALAVVVPYASPFAAGVALVRGYEWRRSDDRSRRRRGVVLLALGMVLAGYAVLFLTGLFIEPGFERA